MTLSLPSETVLRLAELAEESETSRSAVVATLIDRAYIAMAHRSVARVIDAEKRAKKKTR